MKNCTKKFLNLIVMVLVASGASLANAWTVARPVAVAKTDFQEEQLREEIEILANESSLPTPVRKMNPEQKNSAESKLSKKGSPFIDKKIQTEASRENVLDFEKTRNRSSSGSRGFEKRLSKVNDEEQAMMDYSQALECIHSGLDMKAEKLLTHALSRFPMHSPSRLELTKLYLKTNQDDEAEQLLADGLRFQPDHHEFLKLMAVLMERRGDFSVALDFMNRIPIDKKSDKNTAMMLGHIYQRTGHFGLAKKQYNRLLQSEPNNALWLLGLSIAQDSEGSRTEALEGYRKLKTDFTLDSSLVKYVEERITALNG